MGVGREGGGDGFQRHPFLAGNSRPILFGMLTLGDKHFCLPLPVLPSLVRPPPSLSNPAYAPATCLFAGLNIEKLIFRQDLEPI